MIEKLYALRRLTSETTSEADYKFLQTPTERYTMNRNRRRQMDEEEEEEIESVAPGVGRKGERTRRKSGKKKKRRLSVLTQWFFCSLSLERRHAFSMVSIGREPRSVQRYIAGKRVRWVSEVTGFLRQPTPGHTRFTQQTDTHRRATSFCSRVHAEISAPLCAS